MMNPKTPTAIELPKVPSPTDLTYHRYLEVDSLLKLQTPQSNPAHHDEMLFIVIHQAYELWFKLILHELELAGAKMLALEPLKAHHFVNRSVQIMKLLVNQIHILETMRPVDFLGFRDNLNPGSGFQSLQFRELEFMAGLKEPAYLKFFQHTPDLQSKLQKRLDEDSLKDIFYRMLSKMGFNLPTPAGRDWTPIESDPVLREEILKVLVPVYQNPESLPNLPVYMLAEALVELDEYLAFWREHHVRVVERVIGYKRGTGGSSGVEYLRSTTTKKCFPLLWEARTFLQKNPY